MKRLLSSVLLALVALSVLGQMQVGQDINGHPEGAGQGGFVSMPDPFTIASGGYYTHDSSRGMVRVHELDGNLWTLKGNPIIGESPGDRIGSSIHMADANAIAIGAKFNDENGEDAGQVRVFTFNGADWVQKGSTFYGSEEEVWCGDALYMADSNTIAINFPGFYNGYAGATRVFRWNGMDWVQKGGDIQIGLGGGGIGINAPGRLCMPDSNTVGIGHPGTVNGYALVFEWVGGQWQLKGEELYGGQNHSDFGSQVDMPDPNMIVVAEDNYDVPGPIWPAPGAHGRVRVYEWLNDSWQQMGQEITGDHPGHRYGKVQMPDSETLIISTHTDYGAGHQAGHLRYYKWVSNSWIQVGHDFEGQYESELFGISLACPNSNVFAVGATGNHDTGEDIGQVRVYEMLGLSGVIYNDVDQDCQQQEEEITYVGGLMGVIEPGGIIVQTSASGIWRTDTLPPGDYTVTFDSSSNWVPSCPDPISFTINDPDTLLAIPPVGFYNTDPCYDPSVSISMPTIRPCFESQAINVQVCNSLSGTTWIPDGTLVVQLEEQMDIVGAAIPFLGLGDNQFSFYLDTLFPGQCTDFQVWVNVDCDVPIGQTMCLSAELVEIDSCILDSVPFTPAISLDTCELPYDGSNLELEAWCGGDSIYFSISNTAESGAGDMMCASTYRVYVDGGMIDLGLIQLNGGEIDTVAIEADGRTWRYEVDQHPMHPGESHPNVTIELCGDTANWTPGLVNLFPTDDAQPYVDIYCGVVSASYDPNDKTGHPLGLTEEHWIAPNGTLKYRIRFQNTGTDTAFTVVIRDTLETDLNIFSVESGASSHSYEFEVYGPRVLQWTFNNIMLPDSGTNYEGSNGFVMFEVAQMADLPDSTEITNSAAIYFDFNDPIITNTSSHVVMRPAYDPPWQFEVVLNEEACESYEFYGNELTESGSYHHLTADTLETLMLTIGDEYPSTSVIDQSPTLIAEQLVNSYQWIDCESGEAVPNEVGQVFTATENGEYAVIVELIGCRDTSECIEISNVSILENNFGTSIQLFPNPTSGNISIELGRSFPEIEVSVINELGQKVHNSRPQSTQRFDLEIPGKSGVYFVELKTVDRRAIVRVVKEE